ncbi:MAG: PH domain-containing protein [Oscillospiraceae bacterium]|nr:PH domain-containing protein [Oscillospiraceae bacterium]
MAKKKKKEPYDYIWRDRRRVIFGLPWTFTTYMLTETKFITRTGFFKLEEDEIDLYKVSDKKLVLPFWQRLVGCGTIELLSRDVDTPKKEIRCVKKPREVLALLDKQIEEQRTRYNTRGRDLYSGIMPPPHGHAHFDDDDQDDEDYDIED